MFRVMFLALTPYVTALSAGVVNIDFEGLPDLYPITNQFPGVVFSNAASILDGGAGGSLNQDEFPLHSGLATAFNTGSPMTLLFSPWIVDFSAYLTYNAPLTLTAFNAANMMVGTVPSAFSSNLAISGDPGSVPNELFSFSLPAGFARIELETTGAFTLDDLSFTTAATTVPEPSAAPLLAAAVAGLLARRFRRAAPTLSRMM